MSKHSTRKLLSAVIMGLLGGISCQSDLTLPNTLIPPGCRLGVANYINESYSGDSLTYQYDTFGHLTQLSAVHRDNGRVTQQTTSSYSYSADHYLILRADRVITYYTGGAYTQQGAYLYTYQGDPKQIQSIQLNSGSNLLGIAPRETTYQYNGNQLGQVKEVAVSGAVLNQITFGADGKPTQIQNVDFQTVDLANGLISRTVSGRDTTLYSYDAQGQPTTITAINGATGTRTERTLTYDGRQPTRTGELKLRGFPANNLTGYGQAQSNLLTETKRTYRSGVATTTSTLRYTYAYNGQGYATGYARSDGTRAKFYYTNCP